MDRQEDMRRLLGNISNAQVNLEYFILHALDVPEMDLVQEVRGVLAELHVLRAKLITLWTPQHARPKK